MTKRGNPNWKKGVSGNPSGRNPAGQSELEKLRAAIKNVSSEKKDDLFNHFIKRAYKSDAVLVAVMKKIIADMRHIEADLTVETYEERVKRLLSVIEDKA